MRLKGAFFILMMAELFASVLFALYNVTLGDEADMRPAWACALLCELATLRVFVQSSTKTVGVPVVFAAAAVNLVAALGAIVLTPPATLTSPTSPASLAVLAALCWLGFDYWYAQQDTRQVARFVREPGAPVPPFVLRSPENKPLQAAALAVLPVLTRDVQEGATPRRPTRYVVLIFMRGNWCQVCMMQINAFVEAAPLLQAHDVALYFVSSQPLLEQARLQHTLADTPYGVLHDSDNKVARAWGLLSKDAVPLWMTTGQSDYVADAAIPSALLLEREHYAPELTCEEAVARLEAAAAQPASEAGHAHSGLRVVRTWVSHDYRDRVEPLGIIAALPNTKEE